MIRYYTMKSFLIENFKMVVSVLKLFQLLDQ